MSPKIPEFEKKLEDSLFNFLLINPGLNFNKAFIEDFIRLVDSEKSELPEWSESIDELEAKSRLVEILECSPPSIKDELIGEVEVSVASLMALAFPLTKDSKRYISFCDQVGKLQQRMLAKYPPQPFYFYQSNDW